MLEKWSPSLFHLDTLKWESVHISFTVIKRLPHSSLEWQVCNRTSFCKISLYAGWWRLRHSPPLTLAGTVCFLHSSLFDWRDTLWRVNERLNSWTVESACEEGEQRYTFVLRLQCNQLIKYIYRGSRKKGVRSAWVLIKRTRGKLQRGRKIMTLSLSSLVTSQLRDFNLRPLEYCHTIFLFPFSLSLLSRLSSLSATSISLVERSLTLYLMSNNSFQATSSASRSWDTQNTIRRNHTNWNA